MDLKRSYGGKKDTTEYKLFLGMRVTLKKGIIQRDGLTCSTKHGHGCGKELTWATATLDHIMRISEGGAVMDTENMQLLCVSCHRKKDTPYPAKPKNIAYARKSPRVKAHRVTPYRIRR